MRHATTSPKIGCPLHTLGTCAQGLLLLVLCVSSAAPVGAQGASFAGQAGYAQIPNLVGASGLLRAPSAGVQGNGQVYTYLAGSPHESSGGFLVGLVNRLEVGAAIQNTSPLGAHTLGAAKLNIVQEQLLKPAISVGVLDAFGPARQPASGYIVASKTIIPYFFEALTGQRHMALALTAGFGSGLYHDQPFAGAQIIGQNGVSLLSEIVHGRASLGARYTYRGLAATVGLLDGKRAAGEISYRIGL